MQFINTTGPLQDQPVVNQRIVRSHAARQSHHRRWLQECGITNAKGSEGPQRRKNALWNFCQCPVNVTLPIDADNGADLATSVTPNLGGLSPLEPLPSIPGDTKVQNIPPLPSLVASNSSTAVHKQLTAAATAVGVDSLVPSFLHSDWDNFSLVYGQRICSLCARPLQVQRMPKDTYDPDLYLGTGHADPFSSLPIEIQPPMWVLINHCKSDVIHVRFIKRSTYNSRVTTPDASCFLY